MKYEFSQRISNLKASAIREILKFTADPTVISFAAGNPAPEAFPVDEIKEITSQILTKNPISALQYSITEGYPALRVRMKEYIKTKYNIGNETDDLIIVSGAQQGIDFATKVFCNDGDTVICENPSFIGSLNAFKSYSVNLVGVKLCDDGMDIDDLQRAIAENKNVRFIYTIPNFQNPTGITTSLEKRKAIYEIAKKNNIIIVEDNPYGDLRFDGEHIPSIKSFDEQGIVYYCGSFSKILSPGLRVGYVCANSEIISKVVVSKQTSDVHTNILAQMICDEFMKQYNLCTHIEKLKEIYKHKCNLMLEQINKNFSSKIKHTVPQGGLFLWCDLPEDCDMMEFCRIAVEHKVAVVPGTAFMPKETDKTNSFRINFSTPTDEQIIKGCEILGKLSKEMFGE